MFRRTVTRPYMLAPAGPSGLCVMSQDAARQDRISRAQFLTRSGTALFSLPALLRRIALDAQDAAPPRRQAGVGVHNVTPDVIRILTSLAITRVRITAYWRDWNAPAGVTNASVVLAAIDALRKAGIEPLVVVHTPPTGMTLAQGIAAMPAFMAKRAAERRGVIWQIMNEMDGEPLFNGAAQDWFGARTRKLGQEERGDRYGQLLDPVYKAIKATDPTATVVTGGIALEPTAFHAGLAARTNRFDAVAVHCYGRPIERVFRSKSIAMRKVVGSKPLWCTEWGNNSTDQAAQAADIAAALDDNDRNKRYDRHYLYQLITDVAGANDTYGLVDPNGKVRRAAQLLANRAAK